MEQLRIEFKADNGQDLIRTTKLKTFASDTVNYIITHFELAEHWREYERLAAIWYSDERTPYVSYIDADGVTVIPPEALTKPGILYINLCATTAENGILKARLTSYPVEALRLVKTEV